MLDARAAHVRSMHALLDAVPLGLNAHGDIGGPGAERPAWALAAAEDLQVACYERRGFYRAHSDAQNATRRVVTAIYYAQTGWAREHGGMLRLPFADGPVDIEPLADRLVLFRSQIEHEVREIADAPQTPPRCAVTQWFQDLAPPALASRPWAGDATWAAVVATGAASGEAASSGAAGAALGVAGPQPAAAGGGHRTADEL